MRPIRSTKVLVVFLVLVAATAVAPAAGAATFVVASTSQLEAAVAAANANAGADTIRLLPGLYPIGNALIVVGELTVDGPSDGPAVLDGGGSGRVFEHYNCFRPGGGCVPDPGALRLDDLHIRNADGAVYGCGDGLHLERVTISDDQELAVWTSCTDATTITNSTLSGNKAGILHESGTLTLRNVTITGSNGSGGGLEHYDSVEAFNTLIAGNPGGDCDSPIAAGARNLDGDGSCGPLALTSAAPQVGPLQDNGGSTPTHALTPASLAIDTGSTAAAPATDQRGVTRPKGSAADIGAVEMTPFAFESASGFGSVTTDAEGDGATSSDPVETSVTHPGATISIQEGPDAAAEFGFLGQRITIDVTPDATPAAPIVISFAIDATAIPAGQSAATIVVRKDGVVVGPCTGAGATPDPCVAGRTTVGGDAVITVHTSTASDWDLEPGGVDVTPPAITCTVPDESVWYGADVGVPCTAGDGESGLASANDAAFSLATAVPSGTETAGASTDTRDVCDNAGNCATAGPYSFKVDRNPPSLSLPANLTLDATSPAGAVVTYTATASDGGSGVAAVSCSPAPGSTLPIGQTTVTCTATDHAGNAASGSFTVAVAGAKEQLAELIQDVVNASRLSPAAKALLIGKLDQLLASFDPSNASQRQSVCLALRVFKTVLQLQAGKTITHEQAAEWIADANRISAVLGC